MFFRRFSVKQIISVLLTLILLISCAGCIFVENDTSETSGMTEDTQASVSSNDVTAVKGRRASVLIAALEQAGVVLGEGTATKTIYVGEDDNALSTAAKEKVRSRETYYNDYVIMSNESEIAVYGGSENSLQQAITYFVEKYVKNGALTVTADLCDLVQAKNASVTVNGNTLKGVRVVAQDRSYRELAVALAESLSRLTGYPISESATAGSNDLTLVAENKSTHGEFAKEYTVSVENDKLILSAPTVSSLSYAVQCFVRDLSDGTNLSNGMNEKRTYTMKHVDATNTELFKYNGMWQATDTANPETMVCYWNTAYVEIDFTGNAITAEFSKESTFRIKMDNEEGYSSPYTINGKITFFAEGDGPHTLRIYNSNRLNHLYFAGVSVENNVSLTRTQNKDLYIQFIGDSITEGMVNTGAMAFVCDAQGLDFSASAVSGMALEEDYGFWHVNNGYDRTAGQYVEGSIAQKIYNRFGVEKVGMESAFFKLGSPDKRMPEEEQAEYAEKYFTTAHDCKYQSGNTPDVIFTFLGTNDELHRATEAERFTEAYIAFVEKLIATYGNDIQIVVLQAISNGTVDPYEPHPYYTCIRAAGEALEKQFPNNVTFIDRDVIDLWNIEISDDAIHPTTTGYSTLATNIVETLKKTFAK